eukprot:NODE_413_length_9103_cov_0.450911.p2 type:complete len:223 gc:universal NODE_413_length_9103_cov_0.450911:1316-648(-)
MVERKVFQKHLPSGVNPRKVPRIALAVKKHKKVRLCAPFTMQCEKCHEFVHKGKKFNARKEHTHQYFMTIEKFRFYIKCTLCSSEIIFETDPERADYAIVRGAKRMAEPHAEEKMKRILNDVRKDFGHSSSEEELDPLVVLEEKTRIQQQEMKDVDEIEALKEQQSSFHKKELNVVRSIDEEIEWFKNQRNGGIPEQDKLRQAKINTKSKRNDLGLCYSDSD